MWRVRSVYRLPGSEISIMAAIGSDSHRHDNVTIVVVAGRHSSQLGSAFAVLELEVDFRIVHCPKEFKQILVIKAYLEIFFVVVDFQRLMRFTEIGMAGRDLKRTGGDCEFDRFGALVRKNSNAFDGGG